MNTDPAAVVLIGRVATVNDLAYACRDGWYRIPADRAPAALAADWLALYQGAAFGAHRWRIEQYAPIERLDVRLRRELLPAEPAHPRADQRYYVLRLGPCRQLQPPLTARRMRRFSFLVTTYAELLAAADLRGLAGPPPQAEAWAGGLAGRTLPRQRSVRPQSGAQQIDGQIGELPRLVTVDERHTAGERQTDQG
jgi:hypothetical protein